MKLSGKIAIWTMLVLFLAACVALWSVPRELKADTGTTHVIAIHKAMGNGFTTVDDAYAIVTDLSNLDMMKTDTGVADATYTNCDIEFTADLQNTDWALATVPALEKNKRYAITIYQNGTPTAGDKAVVGPLLYYEGTMYTDTNPLMGNRVITVPKP